MNRRFIASALTSILLAAGFMTGAASAQSQPNPIWCGLWTGANLNVTSIPHCASSNAGSTNSNNQNTTPPASGTYASLGDSVAAGLGLPLSSNPTSSDTQCGRSPFGYPGIVAANLNLPLQNLACSGATAGDLVTQQRTSGPNPSAQLNIAFAGGTPRLITITAGANDVHWQDFIRACYTTDCTSSMYTTLANTYLSVLRLKLQYVFSSIQSRSSGAPPQVIVSGYYNPVSTACSTITPQITPAELSWIQQQTSALNSTIQNTTAAYSFAKFVPLNFTGHDACSSDPWVQGMQDAAPFHPTIRGQQAIANAIISALH